MMKKFFSFYNLLRWAICVACFWIVAYVYPHNCYLNDVRFAFMSLTEKLAYGGVTAVLGTILYLILSGVHLIGGKIGMKKNLALYFLYHFALSALFTWGADAALGFFKLSPPVWIYLLIGFFMALLYSVVYSYHVSHKKKKSARAAAAAASKNA